MNLRVLFKDIKKAEHFYNILAAVLLLIEQKNIKPEIEMTNYDEIIKAKTKEIVIEEVELTNEEKLAIILEKENLTEDEFKVILACVIAEAKPCYEDAYAVINTLYNRTRSSKWILSVENKYGEGTGTSIYYQCINPGQFGVYANGRYEKYLYSDNKDLEAYQAVIDFLYTKDLMHDYLNFVSATSDPTGKCQFISGGNQYYNQISPDDLVEFIEIEEHPKVYTNVR